MLPEPEACRDPECLNGRMGNCHEDSHRHWKPTPLYGRSHQGFTQPMAIPGGGRCAPGGRGAPVYMNHNGGRGAPVRVSQQRIQGVPGGIAGPMTPAHLLKVPTVGEEAEGPGTGPLSDTEQDCAGAARRLTQVMTWMRDNGHSGAMLKEFAHSDSCTIPTCSPFCRMFRRVRRHVQCAQHPCMLLRSYAVLLRLHVHSCTDEACGMRACPTLRSRNQAQNKNDHPQVENIKQEVSDYEEDMPEH